VLAERVAQFALVARDVVTSGAAMRATQAFASLLRQAGDLLARSGGGIAEATLAEELDGLIASVRGLLARASGAPVAAIEARAPQETVPESPDLTGSWAVYQRMVGAGVGPASLHELLGAPSLDTARPAAAVVARPRAAPAPAEAAPVDIRTLLYRGERALARAQELRGQAKQASGDALRTLVDEVCDLVALALEPAPDL